MIHFSVEQGVAEVKIVVNVGRRLLEAGGSQGTAHALILAMLTLRTVLQRDFGIPKRLVHEMLKRADDLDDLSDEETN